MRQFYEAFCTKVEQCQEDLQRLSAKGLPAWLILYEFFRYRCALHALACGDTHKFKETVYWQMVVDHAESLIEQTKNVPLITVGSSIICARQWQICLSEWLDLVRKSYLVDKRYYIFYSVPPGGAHFVAPGYKRPHAKSRRGRKPKSADEDLTYLAVVLQRCSKRLTGKANDRSIAEVLSAFFDDFTAAGSLEHRVGTLRSRIDYFRKRRPREIDKSCEAVLAGAEHRFGVCLLSFPKTT